MEERVPPNGGDCPDELPKPLQETTFSSLDGTETEKPTEPAAEEGKELDTYVVQIPKDQIYRVPPPENAKIVESYRKPSKSIKKKRRGCKCALWILLILAVIGALIAITLVTLHKVLSPDGSVFSIEDVKVRKKTHPGYEITLQAKNPNDNIGINYASDDTGASLFFKTQMLAKGKFPELHQDGSNSDTVHVELAATNGELPKEIDKSMNDNKMDHEVSLILKLNLQAGMNIGFMNLWNRGMNVDCKFKVSTLRAGTKILSQQCDTEMK